jgi:Xaa-Pro aminopeptidase
MTSEISDRLRALITESGLDALVCLSPENFAYAAGFVVPSHPLMRWRHAALVLTADGRTSIVCVDMEETTVRAARPDAHVAVWPEFTGDAMATLAETLRGLGLADARIGIELRYLAVSDHQRLVAGLPGAELVAGDDLLVRARQQKTPEELALLGRLSRISDGAIKAACAAVSAGDTEMDIAAALTRSVYDQGAQQFKLMIVATGERSQLPNVGPSDRKLQPGDICRIEIFSVINGYHAGVCRTAAVGDPSPEALRIYANLVECKQLVLDAVKPGAIARDVYQVFRDKFDQLGLPPISFVGHSIGVNLHEPPYLGPYADQPLAEGMVLGMEPLVYRTGQGFGMQIKDMIAVAGSGARLLSDVTDTSTMLPISA